MKYIVILGDGMADYRQPFLEDKTPLMLAKKPYIDGLAKAGEVGLCRTVPCGMKPGSDVANLSVLGYDPLKCECGATMLFLELYFKHKRISLEEMYENVMSRSRGKRSSA